MKILLTHLYSRPYLRRGGETLLAELSALMAARGEDVTVLTTKPGRGVTETLDGIHYVRMPQPPRFLRSFTALQYYVFTLQCAWHMLRHRYPLIISLHFSDAAGARLASWFTRTPYLYYNLGIPHRRSYMRRPMDLLLLAFAIRGASRNLTVSHFAAGHLRESFHRPASILEPPCDVSRFPLRRGRNLEQPVFLAAGAFSEARKGIRVLLDAFALVKQQVPGARLLISGQLDAASVQPHLHSLAPEVASSIHLLGVGTLEDMPRLYAEAAVTVLPSMWEAFGIVLVESLSSGTPVVGTRHGGIPEVITPGTGVLFEPETGGSEVRKPANLAAAMLQALSLYADPDLSSHCRENALRFSLASFEQKLDALYTPYATPAKSA